MADAVKVTLGPRGRVVMIARDGNVPQITKDGVTVSKNVKRWHDDPVALMGMQVVHEVASASNIAVGDGTTTATVLAQAIAREGFRHMDGGANPVLLNQGIAKAVGWVVAALRKMARLASTREEIQGVATIAANGDARLGSLVTDAVEAVGVDGIITVDFGTGGETRLELVSGTMWHRGFMSANFVNDQASGMVIMDNPLIVLCGHVVANQKWMERPLQIAHEHGRPLLIVCDGIEDKALNLAVTNANKGMVVCVVKAPADRTELMTSLKDLSFVTGAEIMSDELGTSMEAITIDQMGSSDKAMVSQWQTMVIGGHGDQKLLDDRISNLKEQEASAGEQGSSVIRHRIAMLSGGVATIKVGGATDAERSEVKDRAIDSVSAAIAAKRDGILPGGGIALHRLSIEMPGCPDPRKDVGLGWESVRNAISEPFTCILRNAGFDPADVAASLPDGNDIGFDADRGEYTDMFKSGIIDPFMVTRTAIGGAASVAGLLLLTEAAIELPRN